MKRLILAAAVIPLLSHSAHAFDPRTHIWVGRQVLADVVDNGKVTLDSHEYVVPANIVSALRTFPGQYLMGHIGPDAHPDCIVGQSLFHPGTNGGLQADDWAKWIHDQARSDHGGSDAVAYAAGYWGHMAGDIIMHSYINAYAGDYYNLRDGEAIVELRHFVLEHYIGDRTPGFTANDTVDFRSLLTSPNRFLSSSLILNDQVAEYYTHSSDWADHLVALQRLHKTICDFDTTLEQFKSPLDTHLSAIEDLLAKRAALQADLIATIANKALQLDPLIAQVDALQKVVDRLSDAYKVIKGSSDDLHKKAFDFAEELSRLKGEAAQIAGRLAEIALEQPRVDLAKKAAEAKQKPAEAALEVAKANAKFANSAVDGLLHLVDEAERNLPPEFPEFFGHRPPNPAREVAERGLEELKHRLDDAKRLAGDADASVGNAVANVNKLAHDVEELGIRLTRLADELAQLTARDLNIPGLIKKANEEEQAAFEKIKTVDAKLRKAFDDLNEKIGPLTVAKKSLADLRAELEDLNACKKHVVDIILEHSRQLQSLKNVKGMLFGDPRSALLFAVRNWKSDMEAAADNYIQAAADTVIAMMRGEDPLHPMQDWYARWAPVFTGVPSAISNSAGAPQSRLREITDILKKFSNDLTSNAPLIRDLDQKLRDIRQKIEDECVKSTVALSDRIFGAPYTNFYLLHNKHYGRDDLNRVYSTDGSNKGLLIFPDMAALVDKDLGSNAVQFDPQVFKPAMHAVTLAKLALLDSAQLNSFAAVYPVDRTHVSPYSDDDVAPDRKRLLYPREDGFTTVLYRAVRSIDGNQQWRGYGLPYFRQDGKLKNTDGNKFGYYLEDKDSVSGPIPGFRLWRDAEYREKVFSRLFPGDLKVASLSPGLASAAKFSKEFSDLEDDGPAHNGADPNPRLDRSAFVLRDDVARQELEKKLRLQITELRAVRLIERIDSKNPEEVRAAVREEMRAEVREELINEWKQRQGWGYAYDSQREIALRSGKPLLLVIDGQTPKEAFGMDSVVPGEMDTLLLAPFVLCKSKPDAADIAHIYRRCKGCRLPLALIIEPSSQSIRYLRQHVTDMATWVEAVTSFGRGVRGRRVTPPKTKTVAVASKPAGPAKSTFQLQKKPLTTITVNQLSSVAAVSSDTVDSATDLSKWMESRASQIKSKTLRQLIIPGSHDSGTALIKADSEIAPGIDSRFGGIPGELIGDTIARWSQAQGTSLTQQLDSGIRYLDLRVAKRVVDGKLYFYHTLLGGEATQGLAEVDAFLKLHKKEIVILHFQDFSLLSDGDHQTLAGFVSTTFDKRLIKFPQSGQPLPPISRLWADGQQVVVIYNNQDVVAHRDNFWPGNSIWNDWANTSNVSTLHSFLATHFDAFLAEEQKRLEPRGLCVLQGVLTPDERMIAKSVLFNPIGLPNPIMQAFHCDVFDGPRSLRELAERNNPTITDWFVNEWRSKRMNILMIDWADESFVRKVIELN